MASKDLKQRPGTVKRVGDVFQLFVELEQTDAVLVGSFLAVFLAICLPDQS